MTVNQDGTIFLDGLLDELDGTTQIVIPTLLCSTSA